MIMPNGNSKAEKEVQFPECHFELPSEICVQLQGNVKAALYEVGGKDPVNIIQSDQDAEVRVEIEFGGRLARLFCLTWCVCVAFESCGSGSENEICKEDIKWDPCKEEKTVVTIRIPAGTLEPKKCGGVYGLCVTVTAKDQCGYPAPIAAMCKGACIMVYKTPPDDIQR
jgi:hypothetical protein